MFETRSSFQGVGEKTTLLADKSTSKDPPPGHRSGQQATRNPYPHIAPNAIQDAYSKQHTQQLSLHRIGVQRGQSSLSNKKVGLGPPTLSLFEIITLVKEVGGETAHCQDIAQDKIHSINSTMIL